jgi:uncharacterized damage-inducible protein DinB
MCEVMTATHLLKENAEYAFQEFMAALDGVTEGQAWAVLPNLGPDYLHTDGTIHGIVHHCAGVKLIYGSICFRSAEFRWRDLAERLDAIEPDWQKALDFLREAHDYWMASWADFTDDRLEEMRPTNYKTDWPAWKLIRMMNQHDSYHAGQIAVLRYGVGETDVKPPSCAEDVRQYCRDSKWW